VFSVFVRGHGFEFLCGLCPVLCCRCFVAASTVRQVKLSFLLLPPACLPACLCVREPKRLMAGQTALLRPVQCVGRVVCSSLALPSSLSCKNATALQLTRSNPALFVSIMLCIHFQLMCEGRLRWSERCVCTYMFLCVYEEFFDEIVRNCLEQCLLPFFKLSVKPIDLVRTLQRRSKLVGDS
jgi:hypothetical protein